MLPSLLHISSTTRAQYSCPAGGNPHPEGQGRLSLIRPEAAKEGTKLLFSPSAPGALVLIALLCFSFAIQLCPFPWAWSPRKPIGWKGPMLRAVLFLLDNAAKEKWEFRLYMTPGCDLLSLSLISGSASLRWSNCVD